MIESDTQPAVPKTSRRWSQFSLRTLLLLFLVLSSSMAVFGAAGIVVFALTVGLAICVRQVESLWSLLPFAFAVLCLMCLLGLLLPALESRCGSGPFAPCASNLHNIALALHLYEQEYHCFPPAYVADKNGKPMHSWRVLILPYLDQDGLYRAYDFNEPWDGPKNSKLLAKRPSPYACPSDPTAHTSGATQTNYVAVVGPSAAWPGEKSRRLDPADFSGRISATIMVVETADSGISWADPRDLALDTLGVGDGNLPALTVSSRHRCREEFFFISDHGFGANVAMADGCVRSLAPGNLSTENLRKILQIGGYREEEAFSNGGYYREQRRLNWPNIIALAVWLVSVGMLLFVAVRGRTAAATRDLES